MFPEMGRRECAYKGWRRSCIATAGYTAPIREEAGAFKPTRQLAFQKTPDGGTGECLGMCGFGRFVRFVCERHDLNFRRQHSSRYGTNRPA